MWFRWRQSICCAHINIVVAFNEKLSHKIYELTRKLNGFKWDRRRCNKSKNNKTVTNEWKWMAQNAIDQLVQCWYKWQQSQHNSQLKTIHMCTALHTLSTLCHPIAVVHYILQLWIHCEQLTMVFVFAACASATVGLAAATAVVVVDISDICINCHR